MFHERLTIPSHRFEYSLPPSSCEGDPAPDLALPGVFTILLIALGFPNGDRTALVEGSSIGDVFEVGDPDRGWLAEIWLR